jgi:hypothetical protein
MHYLRVWWWINNLLKCWKQCIMIDMHVYLPEKYKPPFLHGVFLFSKVGVLVVNFDGFFILAYSSHILWSWPLGRVWCQHSSLSFTLYLKGCQFCPTFSLEKESWSHPYHMFLIAPSLIMPSKCSIRFTLGWGYVNVSLSFLYNEMFSCKIFGTSKLFQPQKSFWHWFKISLF